MVTPAFLVRMGFSFVALGKANYFSYGRNTE